MPQLWLELVPLGCPTLTFLEVTELKEALCHKMCTILTGTFVKYRVTQKLANSQQFTFYQWVG
jgi:hypothetical protein